MVRTKASRNGARSATVRSKSKHTSKLKLRSVGKVKQSTKERSAVLCAMSSSDKQELPLWVGKPLENFIITNVSSFSLRNCNGLSRAPEERFEFFCSLCRRKKTVGKDSESFVRLGYYLAGISHEVLFCDSCGDVLCEMSRWGPNVLNVSWELRSRLTKMSAVTEKLMCYSCLSVWSTHAVFKYGNYKFGGKGSDLKRVCARCLITYIEMIKNQKRFNSAMKLREVST